MCSIDYRPRFSKEIKNKIRRGCYEDRFIRGPELVHRIGYELAFHNTPKVVSKDKILFKELYSEAREEYKRLIYEALVENSQYQREPWIPDWPVRYRSKPSIGAADIILDLPEAGQSHCHILMDWGASNRIAVAFSRSIYLWDATTASTSLIHAFRTTCIKWSPCGRYLFRATKANNHCLMDMGKQVHLDVKPPATACHSNTCHITCAAFHPSKTLVIMGCSKGGVSCYSLKKCLEGLLVKEWYTSTVTQIHYNCNGRYFSVATSNGWVGVARSVDSNILEFQLRTSCRALAWHPWNPKLLAVGDLIGNIYAYQIKSEGTMDCVAKYHCAYDAAVLALSFNPITAELVVSQCVFPHREDQVWDEDDENGETIISVLASFDRVVDHIKGHTGRVNVLCWSPDGTKLATSGTDETARLWNFIDKKNIPKRREEARRQERIKSSHLDFKAFTLR